MLVSKKTEPNGMSFDYLFERYEEVLESCVAVHSLDLWQMKPKKMTLSTQVKCPPYSIDAAGRIIISRGFIGSDKYGSLDQALLSSFFRMAVGDLESSLSSMLSDPQAWLIAGAFGLNFEVISKS